MKRSACGTRNLLSPFPFPLRGKAGAGGFPPRRKHAARQPKPLARIDAAGSPHKRAAAPLWIPCEQRRRRVTLCCKADRSLINQTGHLDLLTTSQLCDYAGL